MYLWIVFLHVLGAFIFALSHGASTKVIFKIHHEKSPERLAALLDISSEYINVFYASLLVMLLAGIANGFLGKWWGEGWIWLGLVLLLGIFFAMFFLATSPLARLRKVLELSHYESTESNPAEPPASTDEIASRLAEIKPLVVAMIGL